MLSTLLWTCNTLDIFSQRLGKLSDYDENSTERVMARIEVLLAETNTSIQFEKFVSEKTLSDDTWRFWHQFVFVDCMAYVSLYLAIRSSNWKLRMSSLTPLFTAFDRPCYTKIIPHHITEYHSFPESIKTCFESGGFTVSTKGIPGHSDAWSSWNPYQ